MFTASTQMSLTDHPISQPSLDISLIWIPVITTEVRKLQLRPVEIKCENCVFMLVPYREFISSDDIYSDSTLMLGLIRVVH
jgi:hypothetical protein